MKMIKIAFLAACVTAAASAPAHALDKKPAATAARMSSCYYEYSIITADAIYDVYTCYGNGDGSY
ncbi:MULTISPECIES: hypothetical protein [unclassified Sphingomonas]|jgi:hypothetical protein|uniref:hypothetical protein n=1 Tax=unclassified Sphingomonas TaxID=196159 RepID=UPI000E1049C2|nr:MULTISPECIES: hypothetical protein [unclassified Sphingomonas]AXJ94890.1 hypothetical protein DM480_04605 [Sphingomonas sp. FARSPH]